MIYHKSVLADLLTPVSAFLRIARDSERAFLLESVEGGEKIGRYSFIGVDPDQSFEGSFADFRRKFSEKRPSHPDLPPFTGGAVGAFCYEMVREFERLPELKGAANSTALKAGSGPVLMDLYSEILAFDHLKHQIIILSHQGQKKVEELEERLLGGQVKLGTDTHSASRDLGDYSAISPKKVASSFSQEGFYAAVEKVKEYIRAGGRLSGSPFPAV